MSAMPMSQMPTGALSGSASGIPGLSQQTSMGAPGQSLRLRGPVGGMGGIGGGMNAWGCWDSTCTRCLLYQYVCNGTACWSICVQWVEEPCERCIWPY
jgi:hypothetical protein